MDATTDIDMKSRMGFDANILEDQATQPNVPFSVLGLVSIFPPSMTYSGALENTSERGAPGLHNEGANV